MDKFKEISTKELLEVSGGVDPVTVGIVVVVTISLAVGACHGCSDGKR